MTPRMHARAVAAAAVVCLLALVGCDGGSGGPSPSPAPTVQPSPPETGPERQQRLDFEAAEKSYRAFRAEYNRVLAAGGAKQPTTVMTDAAAGPYLAEFVRAIRAVAKLGYTQRGQETIVYVRHRGFSPTILFLDTCEDGRKLAVYDNKGRLYGRGEIRTAHIEVRKLGGRWKMWSVDGEKVPSCV